MTLRRLLPLAAVLGLVGCGSEEPAMPTNTKTVPTLEERYQRRTLTSWRSLAGDLPGEERAAQAWALGILEKDPQASLPTLLERLDDPDASVQLAAIVALGRLAPASRRVAERLVERLSAPQEAIRRHARLALGRLAAVALEPLRGALGSEDARVRWGAALALRDTGPAGAPALSALAQLAREDPDPSVRRQARFSMARLGPEGVAACVRLWRELDSVARAEMAAALALSGPEVVLPMADLLQDEDEDLAARAAGVLADQGTAALPALDALMKALQRAGPVRFNAAEALLRIGEPARERVRPLLESDDEGLAGVARYMLDTWSGR